MTTPFPFFHIFPPSMLASFLNPLCLLFLLLHPHPYWHNTHPMIPLSIQVEEHEEEEGDSVTKLHQDMSDAVNILLHCQDTTNASNMASTSAYAAPGKSEREPRFGMEPASRGTRCVCEGGKCTRWVCEGARAQSNESSVSLCVCLFRAVNCRLVNWSGA